MDFGAFTSGLLNGLREGIEAALIVSIVLAYLARTGNARHFDKIWIGTGAAVALSIGIGALLWITIGDLEGAGEDLFEAVAMLATAAVVTWMLFWMRRAATNDEAALRSGVDSALVEGSIFGLAALAFTAVIREGIDVALFILEQATAAAQDPDALSVLGGVVVGVAATVATGLAVYHGARVIRLRTFFAWTGIALIFIAAGEVSHATREFMEVGWITIGTATAFDISAVLPHSAVPGNGIPGAIGSILRAIFGYSSRPEWITFLTWLGYLVAALALYLRPPTPTPAEARPPATGPHYGRGASQDLAQARSQ